MKTTEFVGSITIEVILTTVPAVILKINNMDAQSWDIIVIGSMLIILTIFYMMFTRRIDKLDKQCKITCEQIEVVSNVHDSLINRKVNLIAQKVEGKIQTLPKTVEYTGLEKSLFSKLGDKFQDEWNETEKNFFAE